MGLGEFIPDYFFELTYDFLPVLSGQLVVISNTSPRLYPLYHFLKTELS